MFSQFYNSLLLICEILFEFSFSLLLFGFVLYFSSFYPYSCIALFGSLCCLLASSFCSFVYLPDLHSFFFFLRLQCCSLPVVFISFSFPPSCLNVIIICLPLKLFPRFFFAFCRVATFVVRFLNTFLIFSACFYVLRVFCDILLSTILSLIRVLLFLRFLENSLF